VHLPHRLQWRISSPLLVINQNTRRHRLPRDYIAVVGDSHAIGIISDEAGLARWSSRGRASNALLFEKTGTDVLAIGQGGGGSLGGLVATPAAHFEFFRRTLLYPLEEPKTLLAFFYEGNDLDDNIRELRQRFDGKYADFDRFLDEAVIGENPLMRRARSFRWYDDLLFLRFCRDFLKKSAEHVRTRRTRPPPPSYHEVKAGFNRARVAGVDIALPDRLQSPALELTPDELERSADVFARSLKRLLSLHPGVRTYVVYIPSPLSCYALKTDRVSIEQYHDRQELHAARRVGERSDLIADRIRTASERAGCAFIDTRPALRAASGKELVHGPADWFHPNRVGYAAIAEAILPRLAPEARSPGPS
jgi:hypothetical protein